MWFWFDKSIIVIILHKKSIAMNSPLQPGAEMFIIIVCIIAGLVAGFVNVDLLNIFGKSSKEDKKSH